MPVPEIVLRTLSREYPTQKRTGGVAQVVEVLPSNYTSLSSNSSIPKKKKKKKGWRCSSGVQHLPIMRKALALKIKERKKIN
jgi:hypothetical protein